MKYLFSCTKCQKKESRDIPMNKYDTEKNNQICSCGAKMERVIEWSGIATDIGGYSEVGGVAKWQLGSQKK